MSTPTWVKSYFGPELDTYNPVILFEGKTHAVLRLVRKMRGSSGLGYILVRKDSTFNSDSERQSLHEGVASSDNISSMLDALKRKERYG